MERLGARTITELNVPLEERISQLLVNLDRGRVLLHDLPNEFVIVNIASYWIYLVRGEEVVWNARAQVGKTYRQTPMFRSEINYLVFNPDVDRSARNHSQRHSSGCAARSGVDHAPRSQGAGRERQRGRSRERRLVEVQERQYSLHAAAGCRARRTRSAA